MGRRPRAGAIVRMLQLALDEMDAAERERDPVRKVERHQLARRMVVDAHVATKRWEVRA